MDNVSIPEELLSYKLFPIKYENNEKIFYHGTSEYYSNYIEKYGLIPNYKSLANFFYHIYAVAKLLSLHTSGDNTFEEFNNTFKAASEYYKEFTRISFSAVSLCAAAYSTGETSGGGYIPLICTPQK